MIGRLTGKVIDKQPPLVVIDVGGIGFEVEVSMRTFYELPALQESVSLHIHSHYREDIQQLFGFLQLEDKAVFRLLIKVSGIGVKSALAILSLLEPCALAQAIEEKNLAILLSVPGIGRRTAERLVLELRGKLTAADKPSSSMLSDYGVTEDVFQALLALGYGRKEVQTVVGQLPNNLSISDAIKWALNQLTVLGK